jgi:predicted nucleic acid-binding protein
MATALRIAYSTRRTFYDSTYLALAVQEKCSLVTADTRLFNALRDTTLSEYIVAVGEE